MLVESSGVPPISIPEIPLQLDRLIKLHQSGTLDCFFGKKEREVDSTDRFTMLSLIIVMTGSDAIS